MREPSPRELVSAWLAPHNDVDGDEPALWRLQRWMRERPDDAYAVLELLVSQLGTDVEWMDTVSHQCDLFLCGHREERIDQVMRLLAASPLLDSLVGPEILTPGRDEPRYRNADELASVWLAHDEHSTEGHRVEELIRGDGDIGTRLALEIIERGPLHGFDSEDVWSPLDLLLRFHGPEAIDAIEAAAAESIALRRVIWVNRRQAPDADDPYAVEVKIWERLLASAGTTTSLNTPLPPGKRTSLGSDYDALLDRWFASTESFWAWCELEYMTTHAPDRAWEVIQAISRLATTEQARCNLGSGDLEDLIRGLPAAFVDRIEAFAAESPEFRESLGCVWITLADVPEPFARRYWLASGRKLAVLDAPAEWYDQPVDE